MTTIYTRIGDLLGLAMCHWRRAAPVAHCAKHPNERLSRIS